VLGVAFDCFLDFAAAAAATGVNPEINVAKQQTNASTLSNSRWKKETGLPAGTALPTAETILVVLVALLTLMASLEVDCGLLRAQQIYGSAHT